MTWIVSLISAIPSIVKVIAEIIRMIELARKDVNSARRMNEFHGGIKEALEHNDPARLNDFFAGVQSSKGRYAPPTGRGSYLDSDGRGPLSK